MYARYTKLKVVHVIARRVAIFDSLDIGTAEEVFSIAIIIGCVRRMN